MEEALASYMRALEIAPDFAEVHNNIGTLLGTLGRGNEAIPHFERAVALRPGLAPVLCNYSVALYLMGRLDEAEVQYRRALAIDPANGSTLGHLGEILIELGRLDEARELFERALVVAPRAGWIFRRWSETHTVRSGDPQVAAMEALLPERASLEPDDRAQMHFALGKSYDDDGRYADAFEQVRLANDVKRRSIAYDEAETLASIERIRIAYDGEAMLAKVVADDRVPIPTFVIGMPRSGSTLVEQIVAAHPRAFGAGEVGSFEGAIAETLGDPAFPERLTGASRQDLLRLGSAYMEKLKALAPGFDRVTDKMLSNFRLVGLIHLALPNARIIHVQRDPVDTCLSCYFQWFRDGHPYVYDLGELGRYYRAYRGLMEHWRGALPAGVMIDVRYEDLVSDFEGEARRIVAHCGLDWDDACFEFYAAARPVLTASAAQVRRPLYATSVGRRRRYEDGLAPLLAALAG